MPLTVEDRLAIADLMTGWIHRDLAEWDKLRALFHPDGRIEITWFEGKFSEFVDASMRMGASDLHTKHLVTWPSLTFNAGKVIAETNVTVVGDNAKLGVAARCMPDFTTGSSNATASGGSSTGGRFTTWAASSSPSA